jgi:DNA-binding MarR family transcriptional regulator
MTVADISRKRCSVAPGFGPFTYTRYVICGPSPGLATRPLHAAGPGICVADAAHELRLAPNTASTLVGRLAEQDLLHRERSLPDSRSVRLTITGKARRRLEEWRDLRAELASEVLATMPAKDRHALAGAIPALLRLAERMENR